MLDGQYLAWNIAILKHITYVFVWSVSILHGNCVDVWCKEASRLVCESTSSIV